ncbi:MAG TPA: ABC transporter permease [Steroidobacteraceae bacterium]|jgi:putative ABC transport system permease protein
MKSLRQILSVTAVGLATVPQRRSTAFVIFMGMMSVVAVLVSMLSIVAGIVQASVGSLDRRLVIVLDRSSINEWGGSISRAAFDTLADAPGIAKGPGGMLLADPGFSRGLPPAEGFVSGSLQLKALGPAGLAMHPSLRIVAGRMFRSGKQEAVIGQTISRKFHMPVGSTISMPGGDWPIVGVFADNGSIFESALLADTQTIMQATRGTSFTMALVKLSSPSDFPRFEQWVTHNPALSLSAERLPDYERRMALRGMGFFTKMTYVIAAIMALGALFGTVKNMYAAVRARTREIGTLRAIGYGGVPVAVSVVAEAVIISVLGAMAGILLAWLVFDGHEIYLGGIYKLRVTWSLVTMGLAWAVGVSLLGGVLPAVRAAHIPAAEALRAA